MRTKLVIASVATAAAVSAVGASAYTASITNVDNTRVIGYGATTITGAAFSLQPTFTYSALHDEITGIDVVLVGDTHASTLSFIRNTDTPVPCGTSGAFDSGTPGTTTYHCTSLTTLTIAGMTSLGYALQ